MKATTPYGESTSTAHAAGAAETAIHIDTTVMRTGALTMTILCHPADPVGQPEIWRR
jgi:hypothetical protein